MTSATATTRTSARRRRPTTSRGLVTMVAAVGLLVLAGAVLAPTSISKGSLQGMVQFAAVLAIVALGQTLVIQQGGIDLSVPGSVSLVVVITTFEPRGQDSRLLPAVLLALGVAVAAGLLNGVLVAVFRLNSIVATLGTNALLYAGVLGISGGSPRRTTALLARIAGGSTAGIPHALPFAVVAVALVSLVIKATVLGRRFEAVGANGLAANAVGLHVARHRIGAFVGAQVLYWLGAVLLAGIIAQPTAFQGEAYLLPSVAAVVLGGTSLLGGRGNLAATAVAALFLTQLNQFVLALGVDFAVQTLVQAAALTVGIALYSVNWPVVRARLRLTGAAAPAT
jgi:ribose transport system permease protein